MLLMILDVFSKVVIVDCVELVEGIIIVVIDVVVVVVVNDDDDDDDNVVVVVAIVIGFTTININAYTIITVYIEYHSSNHT